MPTPTAPVVSTQAESESRPSDEAQSYPPRRIYSVVGVPPEVQAYALAKYSRSSQGMLESIQELAHVGSWEIDLGTGRQKGTPETRRLKCVIVSTV